MMPGKKCLLPVFAAGLLFIAGANAAESPRDGIPTPIVVRVVASHAMALGDSVGGAYVTITDAATQTNLGYNAFIVGPKTTFNADQVNANIDYNFNARDRISGKYYFQNDPTFAPFAVSQVGNFPQQLSAGSQTFSLENTTTISPEGIAAR